MGDYKSFLFVWCAKNKRPAPEVTYRDGGTNQQKRFICELTMNDFNYVAVGTSTNKKDAQLNAARDYVQFLVRSNVVSENEVKANLRNEGSEILGSGAKDKSLGLNKPNVSVFKAGVGPQSLGIAYQPVNNREHIDFSALDKRTVDEQETTDVNAAIHGNWTVNEAKNRLNQFMQMNKIKGEYKYSFIGPDNAKTFIAELSIFVPQLGRKITGRESGSSKMAASKSCALSLVRQLFHLGVVERCCTVTGTAPRLEQMPPYPVTISPQLLTNIRTTMDLLGVDWSSCLKECTSEGVITLLAGRQAEQPEDDTKKGRVVTWSPPQANWDPWRGANIDDTNPQLATASMDYISGELKNDFFVTNADRDRIQRDRKQLPIFSCKNKILFLIDSHPVIIIKGATGCGKTTQVCQYILDSWIEEGKGAECNIVVTQPRRISAISVAERVSRERYEEMGTSVGYSVRFETVLPRPYGSMLFCTVGVLLRKLEIGLRGISHVIVDEIHERDVNTDFLLVVLRDTLHVYPELRVILMSATVDTEMFSNYFNSCPVIEVPGRCFDVTTYFLEDTIEMLNFKTPPPSKKKSKSEPVDESDEEELSDNYQQSTKDSLALLDDKEIPFELIYDILMWCRRRADGAVLIFLPGWSTIFSLMKRLLSSHEFRKPQYIILPLHSQLPREEQRLVFEEPPRGVMKIILTTNIAESSITINDVVYVIDCCKVKVKMFTSHNNMIHYATVWASRSNMEQRAGRAGRTANGFCFRLCTKNRYARLEEHIVAEMLRTSLEELALNIKLLGLGSVSHFLSKSLEPPPIDAVIEAQVLLKEMHCLDDTYDLTPLGRLVAKLPLEPRLARMLIIGCVMELGDAAATIASNVSLASEVFDIEIAMSGRQRWFAGSRCSDQLAMLNAFQRFMALENRGLQAQQEFTCQNELSFPALVITGEAKTQIKEILIDCYFPAESMMPMKYDFAGDDAKLDIIAALLTIGSYPNVCYHKERRKVLTTESKPALIIKTSVNCSKFQTNFPTPFFVYSEKLRTKTVYCKTLGMVTPIHLLLFGCNQVEVTKNIVKLDGWIHLEMKAEEAALVLSVRPLLESIVTKVASSPEYIYQMTEEDKEIINLVKQLCEFNSGRYNLPQYVMSKEAKNFGQRNPTSDPRNVGYLEQNLSTDLHQNLSFTGADNCYKQGKSEADDTASMATESEIAAPSKPVENRKVFKNQSGEGVKLDPNTSRAILARHQKRPDEATSSKATYQQMSSSEVVDDGSEYQDYDDSYQNVHPAQQGGMYRKVPGPGQVPYNYNNNPQNYYQELYNNAPRSSLPGQNPPRANMYGTANYYKQRYSQPPAYQPDPYNGYPVEDPYNSYRGGRGRRFMSRGGRGTYPAY